jgi:hypothetical protein
MSPEAIEAAARELCRARGIDPNASVSELRMEWPTGIACEPLAWQSLALEVRRFAQVGEAIAAVLAAPKPKRAPRKVKP